MSPRSTHQDAERGDRYETVLVSIRELLDAHHPDAKYAVLIVEFGGGVPSLKIPVTRSSASGPCAVTTG
jgi:hypothetical protein